MTSLVRHGDRLLSAKFIGNLSRYQPASGGSTPTATVVYIASVRRLSDRRIRVAADASSTSICKRRHRSTESVYCAACAWLCTSL